MRRIAVSRLTQLGTMIIEASERCRKRWTVSASTMISRCFFTDIAMPGMTGDELAAEVRSPPADIKVLLTSGYAEPSIAGRELAQSGSWLEHKALYGKGTGRAQCSWSCWIESGQLIRCLKTASCAANAR